jgi:hypothetical protein
LEEISRNTGGESMKSLQHIVALALLCLIAFAHGQPTSAIRGIKVISSAFDQRSHTAKLVFINDASANITAWGYCVKAQNASGNTVSHNFCTFVDPLGTVIEHKIELTKRPFLPELNCPTCDVTHPGEEQVLSADFSRWPEVIDGKIELNLVAYADGTIETLANSDAQAELRDITRGRQGLLQTKQKIVQIGESILADTSNQHPASAMIRELESRVPNEPGLSETLRNFKRPEWHQGNDKEFIPANEQDYLKRFVAEQQVWISELSKNQIRFQFGNTSLEKFMSTCMFT